MIWADPIRMKPRFIKAKKGIGRHWVPFFLSLFGFGCAQAQIVEDFPFEIDRTRIIVSDQQKNGYLILKSSAQGPIFVASSLREVLPGGLEGDKVDDFLVTPTAKELLPKQAISIKVIRLVQPKIRDRETLYYLRMQLTPGLKLNQDPSASTLQETMTVRVKVFYRPEALQKDQAVIGACRALKVQQRESRVVIENRSPYYLTLPVIEAEGLNPTVSERALMIAPFSSDSVKADQGLNTLTVRCVQESGLYTEPIILDVH